MPILQQQTDIYPDNLFDADLSNADLSDAVGTLPNQLETPEETDTFDQSNTREWWVIHTKPRQEKAVARDLLTHKIPFYLPLVRKDNLIRGRRVRSFIPLFSSYVFMFGSDEERVEAMHTNRISGMLDVTEPEQLCKDLSQVKELIATDAPLTIERRIRPGKRVRIKSGAMMGMEGTVTARRGSMRLLVAVNFLQAGVSIEIDDFMVEPID